MQSFKQRVSPTNNYSYIHRVSKKTVQICFCQDFVKLGEVENDCTSHNFSLFALFLPKIINIG